MFYVILIIVAIIVWKWWTNDTRTLVKGTLNRSGETTLLAANKGLDLVEESLEINDDYKSKLLARYSQPTTTKRK